MRCVTWKEMVGVSRSRRTQNLLVLPLAQGPTPLRPYESLRLAIGLRAETTNVHRAELRYPP